MFKIFYEYFYTMRIFIKIRKYFSSVLKKLIGIYVYIEIIKLNFFKKLLCSSFLCFLFVLTLLYLE